MPHFGQTLQGEIVIGLTADDLAGLMQEGGRAFRPTSLGMTIHILFRPTNEELRQCFRGPDGGPVEVTEIFAGTPLGH